MPQEKVNTWAEVQQVLQNALAVLQAYKVNPLVPGSEQPICDEVTDVLRRVDSTVGSAAKLLKPTTAEKRADNDRFAALAEANPEAITFDNLNAAYIGVATICGRHAVAAYNYEKCLEIFMKDGMSREEAQEWMQFNVTGAYVGDSTPVFVE